MSARILFVTAGQIGDAVLTTGLLAHLLARHPGARVTIVAGPLPAQLFQGVPGLERLIPLAKQRHRRHWLDLWRQVRATRWDMVVDLRGSILPWMLRARERHAMGKGRADEHRVLQLARLFRLDPPPAPTLWLREQDRAAAARLMGEGPVLALAPAANWLGKRWPAERFAELALGLTAPGAVLAGARVAVAGSPGERAQTQPVLDSLPAARRIDLTAGFDLLTVAAALGRSRMFIGNDSGLMHIAAAMGVPTLGLFGPSPASVYAPWGELTAVAQTDLPAATLLAAFKAGAQAPEALMDSLPLDRVAAAAVTLFRRGAARGVDAEGMANS